MKKEQPPPIVYRMMTVLSAVVVKAHLGTNLGLLRVLWALVSGQMLASRGGLLPALKNSGLSDEEVRHAWRASCYGAWQINRLIEGFQGWVKDEGQWHVRNVGGYGILAGDLVGFFRPKLKGCRTKHMHPVAGRALPAIELGVVAAIGQIGDQRVPLLEQIVRMPEGSTEHKALRTAVIQALKEQQQDKLGKQVVVADAEFGAAEMLRTGVKRFVVRGDANATFRRAETPAYKGRGRRPSRRAVVRPLPRTYQGRTITADPPDRTETWRLADGRPVQVSVWHDVLLPESVVRSDDSDDMQHYLLNTKLIVLVVKHPDFDTPLLLVTDMTDVCAPIISQIYPDRWPIEMLPLSAKHMVGAHRQFVHHAEHVQRLPELTLLAGNILSCVAASAQPVASGFWDRLPKATPGRLRKVLSKVAFPQALVVSEQLSKKKSVFSHLLAFRATRTAARLIQAEFGGE